MAVQTKRRGSIIVRVGLFIFAIWMIFYLGSLIKEYNSQQSILNSASAKRDQLKMEVAEMSRMLENSDDIEFIERAARERLGYVYSNEHIYIDISGD